MSMTPLQRLQDDFPWPPGGPTVPSYDHGWLRPGTQVLLDRYVPGAKVILELGVWLGRSTEYMARIAPGATIVSVDTWNPEVLVRWAKQKAPHLVEVSRIAEQTFHANVAKWGLLGRVIPWRSSSIEAIHKLAVRGVCPTVIYLDTAHTYAQTVRELAALESRLPTAQIVGDDWDWSGEKRPLSIQRAVREFCERRSYKVKSTDTGWAILRPGARSGPGRSSIVPALLP